MQKFAFVFLLDAKHFSAIFPPRFFILTKFFVPSFFSYQKICRRFYYIILYDYFCTVLFYSTEIIKRFFSHDFTGLLFETSNLQFFFIFIVFFSSRSTYLRITCDCVQKFIYRIIYYFVFTNMTYSI